MARWPGALLFDFDGVLVNSEPLHFRAFQEVAAAEHIDLTEEEYYTELIGFDDRGAFRHMFARRGRELDPRTFLRVLTRKSEVMREFIQRRQYRPLRGVEEFVRGLWRYYPLGICSGGLREEIETMLEGICLRDCFSVIVSAEDVEVGKPDPSGYLKTAKLISKKAKAELSPADCIVIEDAPSVIRSARAAGFAVLAVANTYPSEGLGEANWVVNSLAPEEVRRVIPRLRFLI